MTETSLHTKEQKTYRNSQQRNQILKYLQGTRTHPNVQNIYQELKPQIPSLSLGNLYRNLGILAEQGLVLQIQTPGSDEIRYDGTVEDHCHFTCTACGALLDLDLPPSLSGSGKEQLYPGFTAQRIALYVQGLCPTCTGKNRS